MKYPILIAEILWKPRLGIYKPTIYWSDGTIEEKYVPKGPFIMVEPIRVD